MDPTRVGAKTTQTNRPSPDAIRRAATIRRQTNAATAIAPTTTTSIGPVSSAGRAEINGWPADTCYRWSVSSQMVNGPSLTSWTAISAPNRPVATVTPSDASVAANRRYSRSARSGGAAAVNPGRRPRRVSANSVNCDTTSAAPPTSSSARFVRPSSSRKIRSSAALRARSSVVASSSPGPTPSRMTSPGPIAPTTSPSTRTSAPGRPLQESPHGWLGGGMTPCSATNAPRQASASREKAIRASACRSTTSASTDAGTSRS